jgi:hypothetical protein
MMKSRKQRYDYANDLIATDWIDRDVDKAA